MKTPKIGQFLSSFQKEPTFQILLIPFVSKVSCLNHKTFPGVFFCGNEGPCQVWAKTESCFPNKPPKNWSICFQRAKRVQISDFNPFFCLKSKLLEPKTFRVVLFCDTEGPCKFQAKIKSCFPNKPNRNWSICFQRVKRVQFSDFIVFFPLKIKLPEKLCKVWAKTESCFPNQPPRNWSICFKRAKRVPISDFIAFFPLKSKLPEAKSLHRSFFLKGHATFGPKLSCAIQISQKKLVNLFRADKKGPNFRFYCFLLSEE